MYKAFSLITALVGMTPALFAQDAQVACMQDDQELSTLFDGKSISASKNTFSQPYLDKQCQTKHPSVEEDGEERPTVKAVMKPLS